MSEFKDCQIKFRLTASMKESLEKIAKEKDIPVSQVIREALKKYL